MTFDDEPVRIGGTVGVVGRWPGLIAVATSPDALAPADATDPMAVMASSSDLVLVREAGDEILVVVRGEGGVMVDGRRLELQDGEEALLAAPAQEVVLFVGDEAAEPDSRTDLRAGVVVGGVASLLISPAAESTFVSVDLLAGVSAQRDPLPVVAGSASAPAATSGEEVLGINCSRGHFNNPEARYCQVCGVSMVHLTRHLIPGPRPTLGFLVFDDGATYALDAEYMIGRSPEERPGRRSIRVIDEHSSVSSEHATVTYDDWSVVITDVGSTNGTHVSEPGSGEWERVVSGEVRRLTPGTIVALGQRTFVFESVTRNAAHESS